MNLHQIMIVLLFYIDKEDKEERILIIYYLREINLVQKLVHLLIHWLNDVYIYKEPFLINKFC